VRTTLPALASAVQTVLTKRLPGFRISQKVHGSENLDFRGTSQESLGFGGKSVPSFMAKFS
jgi:hypothetical protein